MTEAGTFTTFSIVIRRGESLALQIGAGTEHEHLEIQVGAGGKIVLFSDVDVKMVPFSEMDY